MPNLVSKTVNLVEDVLSDQQINVVEAKHDVFLDGMSLYVSRLDKGYSLTDCISMNICRGLAIDEILTHDHHVEQEGFTVLL